MSNYRKIRKNIDFLSPDIEVFEECGCIVLRGEVSHLRMVVIAGKLTAKGKRYIGVIDDKKNADYGVIIFRCEEISRGEILDPLYSPLCVPTLDGIKYRLRPEMGRCQGGFCSHLAMQIIAEHEGIPLSAGKKNSAQSIVAYGETKVVAG